MTEFNNNKPIVTVAYYNAETDQNLTQEEWKALNPVNSNQVIVNQGESYRSWKAEVDEPAYGPVAFSDLKQEAEIKRNKEGSKECRWANGKSGCSRKIDYRLDYCFEHEPKRPESGPGATFAKAVVAGAATATLGPAGAFLAGGTVYAIGESICGGNSQNESAEVGNFISDCGGDMMLGGAIDGIVKTFKKK